MKKISEGYSRTSVVMNGFWLTPDTYYKAPFPLLVHVRYYYEDAIEATEWEPPSDELFQLVEVFTVKNVVLGTATGPVHSLKAYEDFSMFLTERGVNDIIDAIKMQCKGEVKYHDPDSRRPAVSERAREELGWGLLNGEYV